MGLQDFRKKQSFLLYLSFSLLFLITVTIVIPSRLVFAQDSICTVTNLADEGNGTLRDCLNNSTRGSTITFSSEVFPISMPRTQLLGKAIEHCFVLEDGSPEQCTPYDGSVTWVDDHTSIKVSYTATTPTETAQILLGGYFDGTYLPLQEDGGDLSKLNILVNQTERTYTIPTVEGWQVVAPDGPFPIQVGENTITLSTSNYPDINGEFDDIRVNWEKDGTQGWFRIVPAIFPESVYLITNDEITIDGSNAGVVIDGSQSGDIGFKIESDNNTLMGFQINNFFTGISLLPGSRNNTIGGDREKGASPTGEGLIISGNNQNGIDIWGIGTIENQVRGSIIGLDETGRWAFGNYAKGISVYSEASNNMIGGELSSDRNIISGNGEEGIIIYDFGTNNAIVNNIVGLTVDGLNSVGNHWDGIRIEEGSQNTLIQKNIISGNGKIGVDINGFTTSNTFVLGNYIGLDITGKNALGNLEAGVRIHNKSDNNQIGGGKPGEGNFIIGLTDQCEWCIGIILDDGAHDNRVFGNVFGVNINNEIVHNRPMGGLGEGISIRGSPDNQIGGLSANEGNIIGGFTGDAVEIKDPGADNNQVLGNWIGLSADSSTPLNNGIGIHIFKNASDTYVQGNFISNSRWEGIRLGNSTYAKITDNYISGSGKDGIGVVEADNNIIGPYNSISNNGEIGIKVYISKNIDITDNTIENNGSYGVELIGYQNINKTTKTLINGNNIMRNQLAGVMIDDAAENNIVGPNNVIAENIGYGILVNGNNAIGNTITQNSIYYEKESDAILLSGGSNSGISAPKISENDDTLGTVSGTACKFCTIELFSGESGEARWYEGETTTDFNGDWYFESDSAFQGNYIIATATNTGGNTSMFSAPFLLSTSVSIPSEPDSTPKVFESLPKIPRPGEISVDPVDVGTNLALALVSVIFFGLTTTVFNTILEDYSHKMGMIFSKLFSQQVRSRLPKINLVSRWHLLITWVGIILLTSGIESLLVPGSILSKEHVGIFLSLLAAAFVLNGLELGVDLQVRRILVPDTIVTYKTQWIGILIAIGCVIISRAMDFQPGYLYGIVGAMYILPNLTEPVKSGKRALFILLSLLFCGFFAWLISSLAVKISPSLEALLLTIFIISLQEVFFSLVPISFLHGGEIWKWRKLYWIVLSTSVFFLFYHLILNPGFEDVEFLRQNSVQTILVLYIIFGTVTLALWYFFPFMATRIQRKSKLSNKKSEIEKESKKLSGEEREPNTKEDLSDG